VLAFAEWLQSTRLSITIQSVEWVIPLLQTVHILMIGVVFVATLIIALRVLGRARLDESFAEVWGRFAPWMWIGLVVLALTGLVLIIGEPVREVTALSFWLKLALIGVAIAVTVTFGRSLQPAGPAGLAQSEPPANAKPVAIATLVLWIVIIFLGRAIAYDVAVWGALSPASGA
jgi:hypothetical protein